MSAAATYLGELVPGVLERIPQEYRTAAEHVSNLGPTTHRQAEQNRDRVSSHKTPSTATKKSPGKHARGGSILACRLAAYIGGNRLAVSLPVERNCGARNV